MSFSPVRPTDFDSLAAATCPFYEIIHAEAIDLVKHICETPKRWLDTGCGTGTLVAHALPFFPHTEFYLADPEAQMLDLAKAKLAAFDSNQLHFLAPAATHELTGDFSFNVISAIFSHHYYQTLEQRLGALCACRSLLEPGGVLVVAENSRAQTDFGCEIAKQRWADFQRRAGKTEEKINEHLSYIDSRFFPISIGEHFDLFKRAGFEIVELFWHAQSQAGFYAVKSKTAGDT